MQYFEQSSLYFSLLNLKCSERLQYGLCFTAIPIPYWRRGYAWSFDTRSTMLIFDTIGINICIIATKRAKESAKYVASCNREVSSSQGARLALTSHAITKVVIDGEGNNWCTGIKIIARYMKSYSAWYFYDLLQNQDYTFPKGKV